MSVRKLLVHLCTVCVFSSFPAIGFADVLRPVVSIADPADIDINAAQIPDYAISPDGRYAVYQTATSETALYRTLIATGSTQRVSIDDTFANVDCPSGDICRIRGISLSGDKILYGGNASSNASDSDSILLVDFVAGSVTDFNAQLSAAIGDVGFRVREWALSLDGRHVVFSGQSNGNNHLGILSFNIETGALTGLGLDPNSSEIHDSGTKSQMHVSAQGARVAFIGLGLSQNPFGFFNSIFVLDLLTGEQESIAPDFRSSDSTQINRMSASGNLNQFVYQTYYFGSDTSIDPIQLWYHNRETGETRRLGTELLAQHAEAAVGNIFISGTGLYATFDLFVRDPESSNDLVVSKVTIDLTTNVQTINQYDTLPGSLADQTSLEGWASSYDTYSRGLKNINYVGNRILVRRPKFSGRNSVDSSLSLLEPGKSASSSLPLPRRPQTPVEPDTATTNADRGAVVFVHGWIPLQSSPSTTGVSPTWPTYSAVRLCSELGGSFDGDENPDDPLILMCSTNELDVYVRRWEDEANTVSAKTAVSNAQQVGVNLANNLITLNYGAAHLIAHSAGAALIDSAADRLKAQRGDDVTVHLSFLDAYDPNATPITDDPSTPELNGLFVSTYRSNADYIDNYIDRRNPGLVGILEANRKTQNVSTQGFSADVTNLDDNADPSFTEAHAWPVQFYNETMSAAGIFPFGFSYGSAANGDQPALFSNTGLPSVALCVLTSESTDSDCAEAPDTVSLQVESSTYRQSVESSTQVVGEPSGPRLSIGQSNTLALNSGEKFSQVKIPGTGLVSLQPRNLNATVGELTSETTDIQMSISGEADSFAFDITTESGADAMLSVFVDGTRVSQVDFLDYPSQNAIQMHTIQRPETSVAEIINLTFRLDYPSSDLTTVGISNLRALDTKTQLANSVAPNSWAVVSMPLAGRTDITFRDVFSSVVNEDDYETQWILYRYDESIPDYVLVDLDSIFEPLTAYWFIHTNSNAVSLSVPNVPVASFTPVTSYCLDSACLERTVVSADTPVTWIQLGASNVEALDLSGLVAFFESGDCSSGCTLSEAAALGLASGSVFVYNATADNYEEVPVSDTLDVWNGGWLGFIVPMGESLTVVADF